jgi:hypothetical protein
MGGLAAESVLREGLRATCASGSARCRLDQGPDEGSFMGELDFQGRVSYWRLENVLESDGGLIQVVGERFYMPDGVLLRQGPSDRVADMGWQQWVHNDKPEYAHLGLVASLAERLHCATQATISDSSQGAARDGVVLVVEAGVSDLADELWLDAHGRIARVQTHGGEPWMNRYSSELSDFGCGFARRLPGPDEVTKTVTEQDVAALDEQN